MQYLKQYTFHMKLSTFDLWRAFHMVNITGFDLHVTFNWQHAKFPMSHETFDSKIWHDMLCEMFPNKFQKLNGKCNFF